jgi:D-alanine-D-alanine ligase
MKRITILAGGWSNERDISLISGYTVDKAIDRILYEEPVVLEIGKNEPIGSIRRRIVKSKPDVVYNALHGELGEDGTIQKILDDLNIPYTGSGAKASSIGIDKVATYLSVSVQHPQTSHIYPIVIKPNNQGSSIYVYIVNSPREEVEAIKKIEGQGWDAITQEYIKGREFSCAVFNDIVFPVIEIKTSHMFFDYDAKYTASDTQELCPITDSFTGEIQRISKEVHDTLGCKGLTRSDFIVDENNKMYFLEINTSPGMTPNSLCPKAAQAYGWNYERLVQEQLNSVL